VLRVPQVRALRRAEQEHGIVIGLDCTLRVLCVHTAVVGTADFAHAQCRDVFRELIRHNCVKFAYVHNHPGGCRRPSKVDREVTRWLRRAGRWLGIPLLAHVIVPGGSGDPVDVRPARARARTAA